MNSLCLRKDFLFCKRKTIQKGEQNNIDDDLDVIDSNRKEIVGRIQERYRIKKEEDEKQINKYETNYYAAVSYGGIIGMGDKMYAVPLDAFT